MDLITIMADSIRTNHQEEWYIFSSVQKFMVEKKFDWLELNINSNTKSLVGKGLLNIGDKKYKILLSYSPFHKYRYDRIFIDDKSIKYNDNIHLYNDFSLCLYHPTIDQPLFQTIPLFKMIPWISEWIIFYKQWEKYGVWLSNEIKHT